jgi:hypothetical protein
MSTIEELESDKIAMVIKEFNEEFRNYAIRPKTFFDIGHKGHYENPFSDIMSFFLDPNEEHRCSYLFLSSLFEVMKKSSDNFSSIENEKIAVTREFFTEDGKRIDILVKDEKWVIAIENKIYAQQTNPFPSYEKHVKTQFPGKNPYFVLFTLNKETPISDNWRNVTCSEYFKKIKGKLQNLECPEKWRFFIDDFLAHMDFLSRGGSFMKNDKLFNFVKENYETISKMNGLQWQYWQEIQSRAMENIKGIRENNSNHNFDVTTGIETWLPGKALRFKMTMSSQYYGPVTEITLSRYDIVIIIRDKGGYSLNLYYYVNYDTFHKMIFGKISKSGKVKYKFGPENKNKIICFYQENSFFESLDDCFKEFDRQIEIRLSIEDSSEK